MDRQGPRQSRVDQGESTEGVCSFQELLLILTLSQKYSHNQIINTNEELYYGTVAWNDFLNRLISSVAENKF